MPLVPTGSNDGWPSVVGPEAVEELFAPQASEVDSDIELHERYERRFFDDARARFPAEAVFLFPQAPFGSLGGTDRGTTTQWVDFFYAPPRGPRTVLELDGSQHRRATSVDARRDKTLGARNVRTVRAASKDGLLDSTPLFDAMRAASIHPPAQANTGVRSTIDSIRVVYALIEAVAIGVLTPGRTWHIEVDAAHLEREQIVATLTALSALDRIWSTGVMPSRVTFDSDFKMTWSNPFNDEHAEASDRARILVEWGPSWAEIATSETADVVVRGVPLPAHAGWDLPLTINRRAISYSDSEWPNVDSALAAIAGYAYGIDSFRPGQARALRRLLTGGDSLVLLPTGSGKSLIYQVGMLLRPGTTVVVAPIKALIDDQDRRLFDEGIDRVAAIHSDRTSNATDRDVLNRSVAKCHALVALVSPERMQIAGFREALKDAATSGLVNLAVVDEAHCVSEWGHDFRTSYLRLARSLRRFGRDADGNSPPLLALTGTASPGVLRDVLNELQIDGTQPEALQRPPDGFDRKNLRFEILVGQDKEGAALLDHAVLERVPHGLGITPHSLSKLDEKSTPCGIVFVPWAGGKFGVARIREQILEAFESAGLPTPTVGSYSGKMSGSSRAAAANDFRQDRINILVATKAFGMGIDKSNIRWTVHVGLPSSIESFVQEAGRAGRNKDLPAHCVVVSGRPANDLVRKNLDASVAPRQRRLDFAASGRSLGDVGRQLFFLYGSFPGSKFNDENTPLARAVRTAWCVGEALQAQDVFAQLLSKGAAPGAEVVIPGVPAGITDYLTTNLELTDRDRRLIEDECRQLVDKALHRLAIVGVIADLTIDYADYGTPNVKVTFGRYQSRAIDGVLHIDAATLKFANDILPGRFADHSTAISRAPSNLNERIDHHLRYVVTLIYQVIEPARLNALLAMWELTLNSPTDEIIRGTIASYLGEGPTSILLAELVTAMSIDIQYALGRLNSTARGDEYDWAGASSRLLEAYPGHPLLLFVRAGGEAYLPQGTVDGFGQQVTQLARSLDEYSIDDEGRTALFSRLSDILRNASRGSRTAWTTTLWTRWYEVSGPSPALDAAADLAISIPKNAPTSELEAALAYRLRQVRDRLQTPSTSK